MKNKVLSFIKSKNFIYALIIFVPFLMLLVGAMVPALRPGLESGVGPATIYRFIEFDVIFFICLYFIIVYRYHSRFITLVITIIYLIANTITVCVVSATVGIQVLSELKALAALAAIILTLFAYISIFPRLTNKKVFTYLLIGISVVVFFTTIYSLITEMDIIIKSFTAPGEESHFYQIKSLFDNKNTYGFVIFMGLMSISILLLMYKKKWLFIPLVYLFLNAIVVRSKAPLILYTLLAIVMVVYYLIKTINKHKVRNVSIFAGVGALIVLFFMVVYIPALANSNQFFSHLSNYFKEAFIGQMARSFQERIANISSIAILFASPLIIFGYGEHTMYQYAAYMGHPIPNGSIDNAYLNNLLSGGIFKTALFVAIYVVIFYRLYYISKHNKDKSQNIFIWGSTIMMLLYGLFENIQILGSNYSSIFILLVAYTYPSIIYVEARHSQVEPKKVLHVVSGLNKGGTETFLLNYISLLGKDGYKFDIYSCSEDDIEVKEKFTKLGVNIYKGVSASIKNYNKAYYAFSKFLQDHPEYNIVHAHLNFDSGPYLKAAYQNFVNKRIAHSHDTLTGIVFNSKQKILNAIKKWLVKSNANTFTACSELAGQDVFGKSFFNNKGTVVKNIINPEPFINYDKTQVPKLMKEYNIPKDYLILGNISRFEPKKNQEFMVKVFNEVHKQNPKSVLVLGGTGDDTKIRTLVGEYNLTDCVRFIGPRNDVPIWLHMFDYFLMPSLFEGFGIAALEAQICGTKVIASTNVSKDTDLGHDLIEYLEFDVNLWSECLTQKNLNISNFDFTKILIENGFGSIENINCLLHVYGDGGVI